MTDDDHLRQSRLDAIATVRAILGNDHAARETLLDTSDDHRALAHAACGFTAALLTLMPQTQRDRILDGLTAAAVGPDGGRP